MADPAWLSPETLGARSRLIALGARYHRAGWLFGTSGNLSAKVPTPSGERVVVSASGRDKGHLGPEDFVELDLEGNLLAAGDDALGEPADAIRSPDGLRARPSAEASIHLALYRTRRDARVALHVHTVASTLAIPDGTFLPGPDGAAIARRSFQHIELIKGWDLWDADAIAHLPIFPNHPEVPRIARDIEVFYRANPTDPVPALLIAGHGITAWGKDAFSANRHLEVAEFLCQTLLPSR